MATMKTKRAKKKRRLVKGKDYDGWTIVRADDSQISWRQHLTRREARMESWGDRVVKFKMIVVK